MDLEKRFNSPLIITTYLNIRFYRGGPVSNDNNYISSTFSSMKYYRVRRYSDDHFLPRKPVEKTLDNNKLTNFKGPFQRT